MEAPFLVRTSTELPTLHGPDWPHLVAETYGNPPRTRTRLVRPLSWVWYQVDGVWCEDHSAYVPQTYPTPIPDYSPDELAKLEAAEAKRARRAA